MLEWETKYAMQKRDRQNYVIWKRRWSAENPVKVRTSANRWKVKNWERYMWHSSRNNAKRTNKEFNIDVSDIIIPKYCPYLGIELTRSVGEGIVESNPSMDRIDNSKGYIKGNVMVVSKKANRIKSDLSIPKLVLLAKNILKLHG